MYSITTFRRFSKILKRYDVSTRNSIRKIMHAGQNRKVSFSSRLRRVTSSNRFSESCYRVGNRKKKRVASSPPNARDYSRTDKNRITLGNKTDSLIRYYAPNTRFWIGTVTPARIAELLKRDERVFEMCECKFETKFDIVIP